MQEKVTEVKLHSTPIENYLEVIKDEELVGGPTLRSSAVRPRFIVKMKDASGIWTGSDRETTASLETNRKK